MLSVHIIHAHPGIGIIKDSKGNIYFTDLKQVWKINHNGRQTVAVPNVHTHELYIDDNDNIYGEHLWYNGEKLNTWGHYVWCLKSNGSIVKVKDSTTGFLLNYSFARDGSGNMYWVEQFAKSRFKKKSPDGKIITIAEGKFKDVKWMHVSNKGILYFIDKHDLYKISAKGKAQLVAAHLSSYTATFSYLGPSFSAMGIWTDSEENIYVANFSGQVVKKITKDSKISNLVSSFTPWSPTGGVFDSEGNLWLLEYSINNQARARKINKRQLGKVI